MLALDTAAVQQWAKKNREDLAFWGIFLVSGMVLMWLFSDWDFSLLLTLSSLTSMFAFLMVAAKIDSSKSARGVSLRMFECYLLVAICRLIAILPFQAYLPYDKTGDWLYQVVEVISFVLVCATVYMLRIRYAASYEAESDKFPHVYLMGGALILALLFHPSLNSSMPIDVSWTFALYLEAVTVLPQLLMFQRSGKVETFTSHFLAAQALSRVLSFVFWSHSHQELNDNSRSLKSYVGWWVLGMQFVQLIVMADFVYYYVRCIRKGISVQYIMLASETV